MRRFVLLLAFALACANAAAATQAPPGSFIVLCYHEVRKDVRNYPDAFAVDEGALVAQFAWLRQNGYTPVNLDQIVAARSGGRQLPPGAVLLTFDDAYLSFYTHVYPLLREFGYPAVLAIVGSWIDAPRGGTTAQAGTTPSGATKPSGATTPPDGTTLPGALTPPGGATPPGGKTPYGDVGTIPDSSFPTWAQLREMAASGLVEMASHSYDLHRGVLANPQGNTQPAATARIYDPVTGTYESDAAWRSRVRADLARNADAIERGTGKRPRAIAWPYGSFNGEMVRMAQELGSPIAFTLGDDGPNTVGVPLNEMRRILIGHNPVLPDFVSIVLGPQSPQPVRAIEVALDDVYSADAAQVDVNLSALLDRVEVLRPSHIYLKSYSESGSQGVAGPVYFPNRHLPVRADLFNRVAWQLRSRTGVRVFARMPDTPGLAPDIVAGLHEDIARHATFDGFVFTQAADAGALDLAKKAFAWRAPMIVARELDRAALATRIVHEPEFAGDPRKEVVVLQSAEGGDALYRRMRALQLGGAIHFGYGPDDFRRNEPPLSRTARAMSLRSHPTPAAP